MPRRPWARAVSTGSLLLSRTRPWIFPVGSWPTFYATFFGALLGVIGAFFVQYLTDLSAENTLLKHIYCELEGIRQAQIFAALADPAPPISEIPIYRLPQTEFWEAVSSGGALQKFRDPALAFTLASAYSDIKTVRHFLNFWAEEVLVGKKMHNLSELRGIIAAVSQLSLDRITEAQAAIKQKSVTVDACLISY